MPTYVYKVVETGETIEVQQAFTDATLTEAVHPTRGVSMEVKKVFQPVGVTFKGGGFYKTDNRGGSTKSTSTTSTSTDSSGTGSSSTTSTGDAGGGTATATAAASTSSSTSSSASSSD